uniref:NADH dehydrogenase subunit 2 n=1 Tax=Guillardia theta TaxID=55529 RepID=A0A481WBC2_GUITH|nr:NADH dehydrogenase subunit 2 [Guillardia theta]QBJ06319.1 NADH dehydrogenase subunit 2 [Guillardia theta]
MNLLFFTNDWIGFLPEFFLIVCINFVLLYAVIYSSSPFFNFPVLANNVSWLTIQILILILLLNLNYSSYKAVIFNNALILDFFGSYVKIFMVLATIFVILMSFKYVKAEPVNNFEFPLLILFSLLGSFLIISSYDLLSLYLAVELQSFSSYILSALKRNSEYSAEAGLKYFILGAFSSGFLLFGCSLIYGFTGTTNYKQLSLILIETDCFDLSNYFVFFGVVLILVAFFFKFSAAPFHLWSPDIYEGSSTPVTAFFAIVPKLGLITFFLRLFFDSLYALFDFWHIFFIVSSMSSMLIGGFGAIWQVKLKRLLAFSSISHVGYMFIGFTTGSIESIHAVVFYCLIYMLLSISSFSLLLMIRNNNTGKKVKYIEDIAIISKTNPFIGLCFVITFFSIAGIPPLAGFFSKMFIFLNAINNSMYSLAFVGVITSTISCFYYLRIIQVGFFDQASAWISVEKVNKEISIVISLVMMVMVLFFIHPSMIVTLVYNCVTSLCF